MMDWRVSRLMELRIGKVHFGISKRLWKYPVLLYFYHNVLDNPSLTSISLGDASSLSATQFSLSSIQ